MNLSLRGLCRRKVSSDEDSDLKETHRISMLLAVVFARIFSADLILLQALITNTDGPKSKIAYFYALLS